MSYAAGAVGMYSQAVGTFSQGIAANRASKYNAAISRQNAAAQQAALEFEAQQHERVAAYAEQDAQLAKEAAVFREQQVRLLRAREQAERRVDIGASGVTFAGSPMMLLEEQAYQAETEALLIRYQGVLAERAALQQADLARLEAEARRYEGRRVLVLGEQQARLARFYGTQARIASYIQVINDAASSAGGMGMGGGGGGATTGGSMGGV